ncbi:MAG: phosphoribosylformylglycinamidine synthase [Tannerellaceae bacterium]|jgi:phosphoribosylformylglycinamidine synthase|nr:phosphoribosylformylglycinamidine synthase [Tannerellaceae bacterium]
MILFFKSSEATLIAVEAAKALSADDVSKLAWLFGSSSPAEEAVEGHFIGPRREMITPWSTNAVDITRTMGIDGIVRIEEYLPASPDADYDPMLQRLYDGLNRELFAVDIRPAEIIFIEDIEDYNRKEGLALSKSEADYLAGLSRRLGRLLTDSEVYGFAQVNSEHCRHKIFNGTFVIDGKEQPLSLFSLIRRTSSENPNRLVSAYKDNVAFNEGPRIVQFAPEQGDVPSFFVVREIEAVLSLKAETHNFPTTVEPFNGASTGTGGEIRDRLGGGKASLPLAGTAVYMTSYPRTGKETVNEWERALAPRPWLYQTPEQILIKASNGASDFGNKYGQPLICGSLLTFEHKENDRIYGYDKVVMLAGGVGYANRRDALKGKPQAGDRILVLGGDNYRIGMGGGAVSSVNTGRYTSGVELNAVQRANPEMQKRVANVIRSIAESDDNPIVSIHDHGAGGHLNCLSELVESVGGRIEISRLPIGDPTLSSKEIIGNESQERMGILIRPMDIDRVMRIAERERAPIYVVGETTGSKKLMFRQADGRKPIDLSLDDLFGRPPKVIINDVTVTASFSPFEFSDARVLEYLTKVLRLEAVGCKDWLTNKVDRSVTGKVAHQQCQGELQLPLADLGVVALDYSGKAGMATSIGHAPQAGLIDPVAGTLLSIAEALTNIVFAPIAYGLAGVSLSANWMWPCRNEGEDARLYAAVSAASDFACSLGINIPTGKDSLSMTQTYADGKVLSPGTVIISAGAEVTDVRKVVSPVLKKDLDTHIYYVDFSFDGIKLGGSALAQTMNRLGSEAPTVTDPAGFARTFGAVQEAISAGLILAGHDISAGGMVTALLEMCFANVQGGLHVDLSQWSDLSILFAENPAILVQVKDTEAFEQLMRKAETTFIRIAHPIAGRFLKIRGSVKFDVSIDAARDIWYSPSRKLDEKQSGLACASKRFENYGKQALEFCFPETFGTAICSFSAAESRRSSGVIAAILRDKGTNGEREMAYALHAAGFRVKDVHLSDLSSGRETLRDVGLIVFCGGFSNSDVLGSAKGWAAGILYNEKAHAAIKTFYARPDTLSLGICNGCQLMAELGLLYPDYELPHKMRINRSTKFESAFISVEIPQNRSVMLSSLSGSKLGVWIAHREGRFDFPYDESAYHIVARYNHAEYPANPNGSPGAVAGICSADGRHLAMMPHPERAIFPWQCGHYPEDKRCDSFTPWIEIFINAYNWIINK